MEISDDLRCVFSGEVERDGDSYVIEVPERELDLDTLDAGEVYRVALLARSGSASTGSGDGRSGNGADSTDSIDSTESVGSTDSTDSRSTDGAGIGVGSDERGSSDPSDATETTDSTGRRDDGRSQGADGRGSSGGAGDGDPEPPVDRGDEVTVDIEGLGDQGDGIARVDRGYVIIVPDTEKGERVRIRVTTVKRNVAFAEVTERVGRREYE